MWQKMRNWAHELKAQTVMLWFCCRHPETPLAAKILATLVVAYALSPVDLIPDFIPVLGYLDDVILVPLGIYLTLKLVPRRVVVECGAQARDWLAARRPKPRNYAAAVVIVIVWLVVLWLTWRWIIAMLDP